MIDEPKDLFSRVMINIFYSTSKEYGISGMSGFNYKHLKDSIRWNGLRPKEYISLMTTLLSSFMKGIQNK